MLPEPTADVHAITHWQVDNPLISTGIAISRANWIFLYDLDQEKLTIRWQRESNNLPIQSSPMALIQVRTWDESRQSVQLASDLLFERMGNFELESGELVLEFPKPELDTSRHLWLLFKITGSASTLGVEPSVAKDLDKALKDLERTHKLIKNAMDEAAADKESHDKKIAALSTKHTAEITRLQGEKQQLQIDLDGASKALDQSNEKSRIAEQSIQGLQGVRKTLEGQLDEMTRAKKGLDIDLGKARDRIKGLDSTVSNLQQRTREAQGEKDALMQKATSLEGKVEDLHRSNKQSEKMRLTAQRRSEELQSHIDGLSKRNQDLDAKVSSLTQSNDHLSVDNQSLSKQNCDLTKYVEDIESSQAKLIAEAREAKAKQVTTARELLRVQQDVGKIQSQLQEEAKRAADLDSQLFGTKQAVKSLGEEIKERDEKQQVTDANLKTCNSELTNTSALYRKEKARADDATRDLESARQRIRELDNLERQRILQRVAIVEAKKEIEKRDRDVVNLNGQVQELTKKNQSLAREVDEILIINAGITAERDHLAEDCVKLQDDVQALKKRHDQLQISNATFEREKIKLAKVVDGVSRNLEDERQKSSSLDDQLFEAVEKVKSLDAELAESDRERKKNATDLRTANQELAKLKKELAIIRRTTTAKIAELDTKANELNAWGTQLTDQLAHATSKAEEMAEDLDTIRGKLGIAERQLASALQDVNKLRTDLEEADERERNYDPDRLYKHLDEEKKGRAAEKLLLNATINEEKQINAQKSKKISELEAEVAVRVADIKRLDEQIRGHLTTIKALQGQVKAKDNAISSLQKQFEEEKAHRARLQTELNDQAVVIKTLQDQRQHDATVLQWVRNDLSNTQTNLAAQQRTSQNLQSSLFSEQNTSSSLRTTLQNLRNDYNAAYARESKMQVKLRNLTNEYDNLRNQASHRACVNWNDVHKLVKSNNEKLEFLLRWNDRHKRQGKGGWYSYNYAHVYKGSWNTPGSIKVKWEEDCY